MAMAHRTGAAVVIIFITLTINSQLFYQLFVAGSTTEFSFTGYHIIFSLRIHLSGLFQI